MEKETSREIYVALLDEGTGVWRPVEAVAIGNQDYRIITANSNPDDEHWEFATGEIVHCQEKMMSGGSIVLVAIGRA